MSTKEDCFCELALIMRRTSICQKGETEIVAHILREQKKFSAIEGEIDGILWKMEI